MKITVYQHHIDDGTPRNTKCCPVALAIKDMYSHCDDVVPRVESDFIRVYLRNGKMGYERHYEMPDEVADFISFFDDGDDVEPFAFELEEYIPKLIYTEGGA
ncbi:hypothetical protein [Candidatus Poriferisocius sp.]|uniref:hypothetical protein n=1 Tax=Candidatus Poriferisocius sp. TaxID=3101276 RepID=UPI003B51E035